MSQNEKILSLVKEIKIKSEEVIVLIEGRTPEKGKTPEKVSYSFFIFMLYFFYLFLLRTIRNLRRCI